MSKSGSDTRNRLGIPISQLVFGIIVILVGILLLFETTGLFSTEEILKYFPSLLIILGVWALVKSRFRSLFGPTVLILVGLGWQLVSLGYTTVDRIFDYWPIILILVGIYLIMGRYRSGVRESESDHTSSFAIFGDVEKRNTSKSFDGGDLSAIFSEVVLDLRDADVGERPVRISSSAVFSDIDIIVPRDWNVQVDVLPIFSDALDKRAKRKEEHEEVDLIVGGVGVFSDVFVKD